LRSPFGQGKAIVKRLFSSSVDPYLYKWVRKSVLTFFRISSTTD